MGAAFGLARGALRAARPRVLGLVLRFGEGLETSFEGSLRGPSTVVEGASGAPRPVAAELFKLRDAPSEMPLADAREIHQRYGLKLNAREPGTRTHVNMEQLARDAIADGRLPSSLQVNRMTRLRAGPS